VIILFHAEREILMNCGRSTKNSLILVRPTTYVMLNQWMRLPTQPASFDESRNHHRASRCIFQPNTSKKRTPATLSTSPWSIPPPPLVRFSPFLILRFDGISANMSLYAPVQWRPY
jgi:hypothetical protein